MSIPPLVCSTPPPPDQCEDDRDIEDFDIHYNLSQEDEDDGNGYNYGTYSDYIYPTTTSASIQGKWSPDISKKTETKLPTDILDKKTDDSISILPESDSSTVNKVEFEDIVIEDLNLKVENESDIAACEKNLTKYDSETSSIDCSSKELDISMHITIDIDKNEDVKASDVTEDYVEACQVNNEKFLEENIQSYIEESTEEEIHTPVNRNQESHIKKSENKEITKACTNDTGSCTIIGTNVLESKLEQMDKNALEINLNQKELNTLENKLDDLEDDFGDFDDFQFISSEHNPAATIEYCDNPWDTEVSKDYEFGNFTANFDGNDNNTQSSSNDVAAKKYEVSEEIQLNDIDEFGDFDDFKSSSNDHRGDITLKNEDISQNVPVLSLYSPDNEVQIIESINNVLSSIFTLEISECDKDFEGNLESLLNETWGHLVDTDIRQPYIVNWNNSLGQKCLLKALCIDSRNILFGPKWNTGMPKYAANLTVAPLQPQKPLVPANAVNVEDQNVDKNINKDTGTWTDPFTSDGQESCNTDTGTSAAITRPATLDVFTNVMSPEMNKIYSSTLSVQPIRQINLPDTHIFTPTDSETPRSKTIHYDHGSTVLVPQRPESNHQTEEATIQTKSEIPANKSETEEDYWEFQDFKGPVDNKNEGSESQVAEKANVNNTNNSTIQIGTSYETQILQPVKIEPIMPALNWPAPGEVRETFDDFSDFISNTPWNENINTDKQTDNQPNSKQGNEMSTTQALDDDFETFQSAPSLTSTVPTTEINQISTNIHHSFNDFPQNVTATNEISHSMHSKSDPFTILKSKETFVQNNVPVTVVNNSATIKDVKSSPIMSSGLQSNTLLQPSIAGPSGSQRNHKKTGQILQPLSLESYSQINWPNPGIDLQDLSRFNPVESLQSLKTDVSTGGSSKLASPAHKDINSTRPEIPDEDIWGDFVSSKPKQQVKKLPVFVDDDEWTDFVSSPSVKPQNGLNTISLNVHTNLNMQKSSGQTKFPTNSNQISLDIPTLNYVTPNSSSRGLYTEQHFQNL